MIDSALHTTLLRTKMARKRLKNVPILTADVKRVTANGHHITRLASH